MGEETEAQREENVAMIAWVRDLKAQSTLPHCEVLELQQPGPGHLGK